MIPINHQGLYEYKLQKSHPVFTEIRVISSAHKSHNNPGDRTLFPGSKPVNENPDLPA